MQVGRRSSTNTVQFLAKKGGTHGICVFQNDMDSGMDARTTGKSRLEHRPKTIDLRRLG